MAEYNEKGMIASRVSANLVACRQSRRYFASEEGVRAHLTTIPPMFTSVIKRALRSLTKSLFGVR